MNYVNNVGAQQDKLLVQHLKWVIKTNKEIRLTAIDSFEDGWRLHVIDSLLCLPEIEAAPEGRLLDIGSGGGYPGVVLGITTGREVICLDSVKKKMKALDQFLSATGGLSNISAVGARAEEIAASYRESFAIVTARAVSQLSSLIELAAPLLEDDGHFIALKGNLAVQELEAGDRVAEIVGMSRISCRECQLPDKGEMRTIVVYKRLGDAQISLPRRIGVAQKRPLAK